MIINQVFLIFFLAFSLLCVVPIYGVEPQFRRIDATELGERYEKLWRLGQESAPISLPNLVAHLGISEGNKYSVIAMLSDKALSGGKRNWSINCETEKFVALVEDVFDKTFGVAKLALTSFETLEKPLECELSIDHHSTKITLPTNTDLNSNFSFLAFSCNEPFKAKREGILARDLSLWQRMNFRADGEDSNGMIPDSPDFVLGLGDQVYVDPDPMDTNGLSFLNGKKSDNFLIKTDQANLVESFKVLYRYNFSVPPLATALSKLPSMMMWDDHEIRDGWGSQGDEDTPQMQAYFSVARHAFIAYQLLRSYAPGAIDQAMYDKLVDGENALHRQFSRGQSVHILMMDSRSNRSMDKPLFDSSSEHALVTWLDRGTKNSSDLFVLTSGVPLFPSRRIEKTPLETEFDDDLMDGWGSPSNFKDRDKLAQLLSDYFVDNSEDRLLVLSGDVHYSSTYYLSIDDRVVGHEIVTSGIAHALPKYVKQVMTINDAAHNVGRFTVTPSGKIGDSASFAEVVVRQKNVHEQINVDLVFHVNGTKVDANPDHVLANTNLLFDESGAMSRRLWYYPYKYNYENALDHLDALKNLQETSPETIPAGSIMKLDMKLPKFNISFFSRLMFWRKPTIRSAIQAQSSFCSIPGADYNTTNAKSWDLNELKGICERLTESECPL